MSYQLPPLERKALYVQTNFSQIADQYDLFNDIATFGMHRFWKKFMIQQIQKHHPKVSACLDICCGTGDIAEFLADALSPEAKVYALDFSWGMLSVANSRRTRKGKEVQLIYGDALRLPFPDETMDAITVGYGLRNVSHLSTGISEILRVLKPGGIFINLDVGKVKIPIISQLHEFYFFSIVPKIGKLLYPKQDMFEYLPHSSIDYPAQEALQKQLLDQGFSSVQIKNFLFGASTVHIASKSMMP